MCLIHGERPSLIGSRGTPHQVERPRGRVQRFHWRHSEERQPVVGSRYDVTSSGEIESRVCGWISSHTRGCVRSIRLGKGGHRRRLGSRECFIMRSFFFNGLTFPFSGSTAALLRGCTEIGQCKTYVKASWEFFFPLEAFLALYV